jgi:hypothetical protein
MLRLRGRDLRAIAFVSLSSLLLLAAAYLLTRSVIVSSALTSAWLAFALTRPRMRRVMRRLRGETDGWSSYYHD